MPATVDLAPIADTAYLEFDLSGVTGPVTSATLTLAGSPDACASEADARCGNPVLHVVYQSGPRCGDGRLNQPGEQCDGLADGACPGGCRNDCTCEATTAATTNRQNRAGEDCHSGTCTRS